MKPSVAQVANLKYGARVISRLVLVLSVVVLGLSSLVGAQELGATLTGSVSDPSGALVPNATVLVHSEDTNADTRTVVTTVREISISPTFLRDAIP